MTNTNSSTSGSTVTKPVPNLRGKTQIKEFTNFPTLDQLPLWGFDGSSTKQAEGRSSDCVLKPVRVFFDSTRKNGVLVHCEVMMPDGVTPHPTSPRHHSRRRGAWFGFEQEYFFYKNGRPLGFPAEAATRRLRAPTTPASATRMSARSPARSSRSTSTSVSTAGINHEGINAEVAKGQWEFQIFGKGPRRPPTKCGSPATSCSGSAEKYGVDIEYHCKPLGNTDWNGSGMHANFSTTICAKWAAKSISKG